MFIACSIYSLTLKNEVVSSSGTSGNFYHTSRRHMPEDSESFPPYIIIKIQWYRAQQTCWNHGRRLEVKSPECSADILLLPESSLQEELRGARENCLWKCFPSLLAVPQQLTNFTVRASLFANTGYILRSLATFCLFPTRSLLPMWHQQSYMTSVKVWKEEIRPHKLYITQSLRDASLESKDVLFYCKGKEWLNPLIPSLQMGLFDHPRKEVDCGKFMEIDTRMLKW